MVSICFFFFEKLCFECFCNRWCINFRWRNQ